MVWVIALVLVVAAVFVGLRLRRKPRTVQPALSASTTSAAPRAVVRPKPETANGDGFRGCLVMPQKDGCEAVQRLRGQTFPIERVIVVPVVGCDRNACECHLHRVVGRRRVARRSQADRRTDVRFTEDRRSGRDRRKGVDVW